MFPVAAILDNCEDWYLTRTTLTVNDLKHRVGKPKNHINGSTHKLKVNVLSKKRDSGEQRCIYRCYRKLSFDYTSGTIILSGAK